MSADLAIMSTGVKRDHAGNTRAKGPSNAAPPGRFNDMFEGFRDELDEHYDRKERIVKVSRDVTGQSKKIIFALQRLKQPNEDFPPATQKDIDTRLDEVTKLLESITPDLRSDERPLNRHRYASQLRGVEELVEAVSFAHYLRHQALITEQETATFLPEAFLLLSHEHMGGIFDLFGEMMRFATVTTAQTGKLAGDHGRTILGDIQELACRFEMLPEIPTKDFRSKMTVMRQSVLKVEKLGYGLVVRGSERPKGWLPDMKDDAPEPVSP